MFNCWILGDTLYWRSALEQLPLSDGIARCQPWPGKYSAPRGFLLISTYCKHPWTNSINMAFKRKSRKNSSTALWNCPTLKWHQYIWQKISRSFYFVSRINSTVWKFKDFSSEEGSLTKALTVMVNCCWWWRYRSRYILSSRLFKDVDIFR